MPKLKPRFTRATLLVLSLSHVDLEQHDSGGYVGGAQLMDGIGLFAGRAHCFAINGSPLHGPENWRPSASGWVLCHSVARLRSRVKKAASTSPSLGPSRRSTSRLYVTWQGIVLRLRPKAEQSTSARKRTHSVTPLSVVCPAILARQSKHRSTASGYRRPPARLGSGVCCKA